jgi:hypothetical protein
MFIRSGESLDQLIWTRAPRASALNDSPTLLPPAELAMELTIADMHENKPGHGRAIRFWKHEPDCVWIEDL